MVLSCFGSWLVFWRGRSTGVSLPGATRRSSLRESMKRSGSILLNLALTNQRRHRPHITAVAIFFLRWVTSGSSATALTTARMAATSPSSRPRRRASGVRNTAQPTRPPTGRRSVRFVRMATRTRRRQARCTAVSIAARSSTRSAASSTIGGTFRMTTTRRNGSAGRAPRWRRLSGTTLVVLSVRACHSYCETSRRSPISPCTKIKAPSTRSSPVGFVSRSIMPPGFL